MEYELSEKDKKAMDDAFDSMFKYLDECNRQNKRLMKAIKSVMGDGFHNEVAELFEENEVYCGVWYAEPHKIVRHCPVDKNQCDTEDWQHIFDYRVEQWAQGDSGDSWAGYFYVKLNKGKWLKAYFNC